MVKCIRWVNGKESGDWTTGLSAYTSINSEDMDTWIISDCETVPKTVFYNLEDLNLVHDGVTITNIDIYIRHQEADEALQTKVAIMIPNGHLIGEQSIPIRETPMDNIMTFPNLDIYGGDWNSALLKLTADSNSNGASLVFWVKLEITFTILDFKTTGSRGAIYW